MKTSGYSDRDEAGRAHVRALERVISPPIMVIAIPRGGLVVGWPIAERWRAPLTISYVRKLALPVAPELAVGALDEDGHVLVDHDTLRQLGGAQRDLIAARERVAHEIRRQQDRFQAPSLLRRLPECTAVLVDDGLATGLTMRACLAHVRRHGARQVVVAAPCAAASTAATIAAEADRLVCPIVDPEFVAVGAYYESFAPVTDEEVLAILARARPFAAGLVETSSSEGSAPVPPPRQREDPTA